MTSARNTDPWAARTALVDILYQRSFLLSVPLAAARERRHASNQRNAERIRQLGWISPEDALYIGGTRRDLESALNSGAVDCRSYHVGRWWLWKEAEPREAIRIGSDGRSRVDNEQWALRVREEDWREYLGKSAASVSNPDDVPSATDLSARELRDADEDTIRNAIKGDYEERKKAGEKPLNLNEIITPVKRRLQQIGFYAARKTISEIAHSKEFEDLRERPGPAWKKQAGR